MAETNNRHDEERHFVERRNQHDWMTKAISVFTGTGWLFACFMMMIFSKARPGSENFFTRVLHLPVNRAWNVHLLWLTLAFLIATFAFCVFGILFSLMRYRRKSDRFNKPLIFLSIMSAIGIALFLVKFSFYL